MQKHTKKKGLSGESFAKCSVARSLNRVGLGLEALGPASANPVNGVVG